MRHVLGTATGSISIFGPGLLHQATVLLAVPLVPTKTQVGLEGGDPPLCPPPPPLSLWANAFLWASNLPAGCFFTGSHIVWLAFAVIAPFFTITLFILPVMDLSTVLLLYFVAMALLPGCVGAPAELLVQNRPEHTATQMVREPVALQVCGWTVVVEAGVRKLEPSAPKPLLPSPQL